MLLIMIIRRLVIVLYLGWGICGIVCDWVCGVIGLLVIVL